MMRVCDNPGRSRYELPTTAGPAVLEYRLEGTTIVLTHAEVPPAVAGGGVGSQLVRGALDDIRTRGLRVVPACSFVGAIIRRYPQYRDLLAG